MERKGKKMSVMFECLEGEETDTRRGEIPENGANVAYRHINIANVLGAMIGKKKELGKGFPSIIDTCFNGGGLWGFSRLGRYGEYLGSFYPKAKTPKKNEKTIKFVFLEPQGEYPRNVQFYRYG